MLLIQSKQDVDELGSGVEGAGSAAVTRAFSTRLNQLAHFAGKGVEAVCSQCFTDEFVVAADLIVDKRNVYRDVGFTDESDFGKRRVREVDTSDQN